MKVALRDVARAKPRWAMGRIRRTLRKIQEKPKNTRLQRGLCILKGVNTLPVISTEAVAKSPRSRKGVPRQLPQWRGAQRHLAYRGR